MMLAPYILRSQVVSQLEKIDSTTTLEGTLYLTEYGPQPINVTMKAHAYIEDVKGENIVMKVESIMTRTDTIRLQNTTAVDLANPVCTRWKAISFPDRYDARKYHIERWKDNNKDGNLGSPEQIKMWGADGEEKKNWTRWYDVDNMEYGATCYMAVTNETIPRFSVNMTRVFNKFNRKYVPDAPEADINRTGYGATLYPSHLKAGENISDVWIGNFNNTETLEYKESIEVEGVTLYKYFLNKTITKIMDIEELGGPTNMTLSLTETVLVEPSIGAPTYIENSTFTVDHTYSEFRFIRLMYKFSDESRAEGIENAKRAYEGLQLLEVHIPIIFGVIAIILAIGFALNILRLRRKKPPE